MSQMVAAYAATCRSVNLPPNIGVHYRTKMLIHSLAGLSGHSPL